MKKELPDRYENQLNGKGATENYIEHREKLSEENLFDLRIETKQAINEVLNELFIDF